MTSAMKGLSASARVVAAALVAVLLVGVLAPVARAQEEPTVTARIDPMPVFVGQTFQFTISVSSEARPETPSLSSLDAGITVGGMSTGQSTSMVVVNGRTRATSTYDFAFDLRVERPGTYRIPSIPVRVGGTTVRTNEIRFTAGMAPETNDLRVEVEVDRASAYVGEPITYRLTIYATTGFSGPRFMASGDFERFAKLDVPGWQGTEEPFEFLGGAVSPKVRREVVDGRVVLVVELARRLVAREAGAMSLGPVRVTATLLRTVQDGLFQRRRSAGQVSATSGVVGVEVRPLPSEGRPEGFGGLVGRYSLHAEVEPSEVNVGDPMKLHVLVTGGPLVDEIEAPDLSAMPGFDAGFRVSNEAPERQDAAGGVVFTYQLRALDDSIERVPEIVLAYFDPERESYGVARSDPIRLRVRPTKRVTVSDAVGGDPVASGAEVEDVRRGIAFNYEGADALRSMPRGVIEELRSPVWVASIAGPPLLYGAGLLAVGVRRRGAGRGPARQRARALGEASAALGRAGRVDEVVAAISGYFESVTGRRGASLTPGDCEAIVAPVSGEGARRLHALMERCDAARFAGAGEADVRGLGEEARDLLREIDPGLRRASR